MAEEIGFRIRTEGIKQLTSQMTELQTQITSLAAQKQVLNKQTKELTKAYQDGEISVDQYDESLSNLSAEQVENTLATNQATAAYNENRKSINDTEKATEKQSGSLAQLRIELAQSKKAWTNLSKEERENADVGGELLKTQQALDTEVRGLEKQIGVTSRNVGNYGDAVSEVTPLMGAFGGKINQVQQTLGQVKKILTKVTGATKANSVATKGAATSQTALGAATKGTAGGFNLASKAAKLFKIALISTGIGAIVVLLGSLIAAFATTQRGMDIVTRAVAPLKEIFATLFGLIQKLGLKVFDQLKAAINDPGKALKDLGEAIKKNLINRFTAAVNLVKLQGRAIVVSFKAMGLGIKKALSGVPLLGAGIDKEQLEKDLQDVKEEAIQVGKEIAQNLVQVSTGLDPDQQAALIQGGKDFAEQMAIAAERGARIAELTIEIEENEIGLNRAKEKGNRLFEEQKKIAEDTLLTDAQRIEAAKNAQKILKETEALEIDQLNRQIELAKIKTEANDTDREALKEIEELEAEKERIQAQNIAKSIELRNKENAIIKTRIAAIKKAQDDEIKRLQKLEAERDKIAEKDKERALQNELAILEIKANTLQMERELEIASVDETDQIKLEKELELQQQLTDIKLQAAQMQADALQVKEGELQEKLKQLRAASSGEETIEILKVQDQLNIAKQERERIQNQEMAVIKEENQIAQDLKQAEYQTLKDEEELTRLKAQEDFKVEVRTQALETVQAAGNALVDASNKRAARQRNIELANLNAKLENDLITQEEFEAQKLAIEKKAFNRKKALELAGIAISLAQEIASINAAAAANPSNAVTFGGAGVSQAAILTALAVGRSAVQAGIVASQSFAEGGFTGSGQGAPDSSGHKVAGVVHANEYVVPKKVLSTPQGAAAVGSLEQMRLKRPTTNVSRGFVTGGFTSAPEPVDMKAFEESITNSVVGAIEQIPVVNNATETAGIVNEVNNVQSEVNF